jgi:hypothetical protein
MTHCAISYYNRLTVADAIHEEHDLILVHLDRVQQNLWMVRHCDIIIIIHLYDYEGVGKCDTATTRTEAVYLSFVDNNQRYIFTNGIPNHCYQVL